MTSYVAGSEALDNQSAGGVSIPLPAGATTGTLLVALIYSSGVTGAGDGHAPSGWSGSGGVGVDSDELYVWWKVAASGDTGPFLFGGGSMSGGVILAYSGAGSVEQIDVVDSSGGSLTTAVAPSVTPTGATDTWVVAFADPNNQTWSTPAGMTAREAVPATLPLSTFDLPLTGTSPTGTASSSPSGSGTAWMAASVLVASNTISTSGSGSITLTGMATPVAPPVPTSGSGDIVFEGNGQAYTPPSYPVSGSSGITFSGVGAAAVIAPVPAVRPTLVVKVAFGSNPNDETLVWTDISRWARKLKTMRGRTRLLRSQAQFEAGTLSGELDNRDRRFDPTNTAGPYYPDVQPEKMIQVGAEWEGHYQPIWTGLVDDWPQQWPGFSEGNIQLVATDLFKSLAIKRVLSAGYSQAVTLNAPTGWWRCGEPPPVEGTTVQTTVAGDSSGNNHPAVYSGTVTLGTSGALVTDPNTAISVSGKGWVLLPQAANIAANGPATVELWMRATAAPAADQMLWQQAGGSSDTNDIASLYVTTGGRVQFDMYSGSAQIVSPVGVGPDVCDGLWHHIVAVIEGGVQLYVDGVDIGDALLYGTWSWTPTNMVAAFGGSLYTGSGSYYPGGTTPATGPQFHGDLDELAVYPTALTAAAVTAHYQGAAFPAETTGQRVNRVLDVLGQPTSRRRVDAGRTFCQIEKTNENQTKALLYLQRCEQTEQGQFYVGADGATVFEDRYHRYNNPGADPVATVGDGGAAFPVPASLYPPVAYDTPTAWWKLADPAGSATAADSSLVSYGPDAGGHTGTVTGGVTFGPTGPDGVAGHAALFDGTSGYIGIDGSLFNPGADPDGVLSVEAWIKTTSTEAPVFYAAAPAVSGYSYLAYIEMAVVSGQAQFFLSDPQTGNSEGVGFVGPTINDGQWHHLVGTQQPAVSPVGDTLWQLYVDGALVGSHTGTYAYPAGYQSPGYLGYNPLQNGGAGRYLAGSLADVVVYRFSALDPGRILDHFDAASPSTELPYSMGGVVVHFDRMELYNEIPATRQGGNTQVAINQDSVTKYADRTMIGGLFDLLMADDADALYCAQWILADTAYPQLRVGQLRFDPNTDRRLWNLVLGYDIGTVITVNKHRIPGGGPGISVNCRIEGVEHQIDPPNNWTVVWHLSLQGTLPWCILDDPVMGVLDSGARWGW
ncbi:LamG domain-containing protein [Acidiferrimicrobium sp. IK]|uniref:LamG domain-containing protein n=1 Tax=Acidiferrimicrobium sp. IK TaxID=2871700 RepID=UPI0021CB7F8A|nr:LamG domain-containing protein [Acidiferrimicrobium sp. IK]MCU4184031.1 LamG domain-containing protein [Acidiferrimicrobium sp. IK]